MLLLSCSSSVFFIYIIIIKLTVHITITTYLQYKMIKQLFNTLFFTNYITVDCYTGLLITLKFDKIFKFYDIWWAWYQLER